MLMGGKKYPPKILAFLTCFAFAVCGCDKSTTPEPPELTLLGTFDYSGYINEIFVQDQFVYLAAREYDSAMAIINAVEPALPTLASIYYAPSAVYDIFISGNHAYLACGNSDLIILDISDPYNPAYAGNYSLPESPYFWASAVCVEGSYLYLGAGDGGLQILDISNPSQPALIGSTVSLPGVIYEMSISGSNAYLLSESFTENSFLDIVDITYPFNPEIIGGCNFPWRSHHISIVGEYAYLTLPYQYVSIYSVADPQDPYQVTEIETPGTAADVFASGSYAYVADGDSGLQIIDIFLPANPFIAASYDISGYASLIFQENEYIYLVKSSMGLMIFRYAPRIVG
jgi:hypothetical protein